MSQKQRINVNSRILVQRSVGEIEKDGQKYIQAQWSELSEPLNLGSLSKPRNTDIMQIKIEIPEKRKGNILEGLFG